MATMTVTDSTECANLMIIDGEIAASTSDRSFKVPAWVVESVVSGSSAEYDGATICSNESAGFPQLVFMSRQLEISVRASSSPNNIHLRPFVQVLDKRTFLDNLDSDHLIIGDHWYPISQASFEPAKQWLSSLSDSRDIPISDYPLIYRNFSDEFEMVDEVDFAHFSTAAANYKLPESLHANLYSYQQVGYGWMAMASHAGIGCILGDEMGLGKTLQVIAVIAEHLEQDDRPSLVIAPVTLIENWTREIFKFAPSIGVYRHIGPSRARNPGAISKANVVITSYETAVNDVGLLSMIEWDVMVLDEAQQIKNPGTKRAIIINQFPRKTAIAVTGTPLENSTEDVWSLCDIVTPNYLGTREEFRVNLADRPDLVAAALKPILLRREVATVRSDLPEKTENEIPLQMFDHEMAGYERLIKQIGVSQSSDNALATLTRLRQFTGHPGLLDSALLNDPLSASSKMTRMIEMLVEVADSGQKALIFSTFTKLSDLIARTVEINTNAKSFMIDGRVAPRDRQTVVDEFSNYPGAAVLIMHPVTGGTGLNITAASHVFHYTLEWNPAKDAQATARAFRIGQKNPVFVHRFFYTQSIDENMLDVLHKKTNLANVVVEESDDIAIDLVNESIAAKKSKKGR